MLKFVTGALVEKPSSRTPTVYVAKYNVYIDNIMGRMNRILRKMYDPVSVRLQPVDPKKKSKRSKSGKKKNSSR